MPVRAVRPVVLAGSRPRALGEKAPAIPPETALHRQTYTESIDHNKPLGGRGKQRFWAAAYRDGRDTEKPVVTSVRRAKGLSANIAANVPRRELILHVPCAETRKAFPGGRFGENARPAAPDERSRWQTAGFTAARRRPTTSAATLVLKIPPPVAA